MRNFAPEIHWHPAMSISKTRQKLITVARELFAKQGFDGITMNDIAQASQKGRRTMYTYFSSKEDIYYAVIEDELEHLSEEMDKVVNLSINPQEKIVKIITPTFISSKMWLSATVHFAQSSSATSTK